jgi:hypothetical protein
MDAVLEMCTPIHDKIEKASLPSRAQLNMHIDADEFFIRMYRGRFRQRFEPLTSDSVERGTGEELPLPGELDDMSKFAKGYKSKLDESHEKSDGIKVEET